MIRKTGLVRIRPVRSGKDRRQAALGALASGLSLPPGIATATPVVAGPLIGRPRTVRTAM